MEVATCGRPLRLSGPSSQENQADSPAGTTGLSCGQRKQSLGPKLVTMKRAHGRLGGSCSAYWISTPYHLEPMLWISPKKAAPFGKSCQTQLDERLLGVYGFTSD
ncbi:unnamed protein product [Ostreobium quekettii]|uniref:Uncharacterized protein n=1 Tax=Ostreobium quekettii TaxID=121088 RepID=A0A8S1J5H8_9CHLO|nr:unnamed protein product [Ostreobium quekettii]